ncbi:hypothetical protein, partial [Treponema endosymbiont of Eucomonympha sp.]|uniref:hypothetical protein n=1 Tax=Treponema endosymbiont of Eucomonympha sp. TaxID=1580831 RepID=UPI001E659793
GVCRALAACGKLDRSPCGARERLIRTAAERRSPFGESAQADKTGLDAKRAGSLSALPPSL